MFHTPPGDKKELSDRLESEHVGNNNSGQRVCTNEMVSSQIPSQQNLPMPSNVKLEVKREKIASAYASSMSTSFSNVRRKQLELAAAEAKAKIQLDLIEKKLEYDLAANDYESEIHAPHSIHSSRCRSNASRGHDCSSKSLVNEWMEQNEVQQSPILQAAATATEAARIPTVYPIRAQAQGPPVDSILQLAHTLKDIMIDTNVVVAPLPCAI
ncbi:uncharacterized protein [Epargyreus clarus]|uniref:uncharacterized protein n=1 Tax=Epargyreus clarus TaxID=520877 RepID=UPI003C2FDFEF